MSKNRPKSSNGKQDANKTLNKVGSVFKVISDVSRAGKTVIDLISLLKNHPEWYTHYDTSKFIALNLANKQNRPYQATTSAFVAPIDGGNSQPRGLAMPTVASARYFLTLPKGDDGGWRTGIRLLYQQVRTANAGKINYEVTDLEKYVFNVAQLKAMNSWLKRLYNITYTFRSTTSALPKHMLYALSANPDNIIANAANLLMYQSRFAQRCRVTFPLNNNLLDRRSWMFGNVFADSDSSKPSFYVPTFANVIEASSGVYANDIQYFVSNSNGTWSVAHMYDTVPSNYLTYQMIHDAFDKVIDALIDDVMMSTIAGDIIKAFGDKAFYPCWEEAGIDEAVTILYDENALSQFQNAQSLNIQAAELYSDFSSGGFTEMPGSHAHYILSIDSAGWADGELTTGWSTAKTNFSIQTKLIDMLVDKFNNPTVNWHNDSISAGEVMSITRLLPAGASRVDKGNQHQDIEFNVWGTEVLESVYAVVQQTESFSVTAPLTADVGLIQIAGTLVVDNLNNTVVGAEGYGGYLSYLSTFAWSYFDWAPRLRFAIAKNYPSDVAGTAILSDLSPDMLDWDVFADVSEQNLMTYYSYSNQSILYSGPSQNQSNRKVYAKSSGSKRGTSADKPAPEASDKS